MSDFLERLEQQLVAATPPRSRWHRGGDWLRFGRARAWAVLPPVALIVAALAVAGLTRVGGSPIDELEATATPQTSMTASPQDVPRTQQAPGADTLESTLRSLATVYGVFARPARASDRVPPSTPILESAPGRPVTRFDRNDSRRLAVDGDRVLYAVPAVENGRAVLCTVLLTNGGAPGASGCGPFDPERVNTRPRWSSMFARPAPVYSLLLPDNVTAVEVHLKSGSTRTEPVQDNAVLFAVKGLDRISWRDPTGQARTTRATI